MKIISRIETVVHEEILKRDIHRLCWRVKTYAQCYPHAETNKKKYLIKIVIPSEDSGKLFEGTSHSFIDFWYDHKKKQISSVWVYLDKKDRNIGHGRDLVELIESVGRKLDCTQASFSIRDEESTGFWNHMGYVWNGKPKYSGKGALWSKKL